MITEIYLICNYKVIERLDYLIMKKNLLSVLILALLIVNIAMTAIMMVSVLGTNNKTGALVTSIARVMNLELYEPGESANNVPLSQTATYALADRLMIQLKPSVDEEGNSTGASMVIFYMALAMDTEHKDYKELGSEETLQSFEIQIKDTVASVVHEYTEQEFSENSDQVKAEILSAIQDLFQSDFIYRVSISDVIFQ